MTARPRRWSLRDRAFAVALLVGAAPFVFLVVLSRIELHEADVSAARAREALGLIRARLDAHRSVEEIEGELRASPSATNLRIRAVDRKGTARFDVNRSVDDTWPYRVGNFFYGPVGPALSSLEAGEGALGARPESAGPTGEDSRFAPGGNALIHVVNQWWHDPLRDEDVQFHVQAYSRRAVLPQFARERQIIKWLSVSLVIALVAGWLLSRQLIRPLEQLRRELLGRAAAAVPKTGLTLDRSDEVGDLANAFNSVLTALAERNKANEAFLTDLAHEFKNPVAAIKTCADLMAGGTLTAERTTKLTEVLHASCAQLDRLVTQFLELSRAEAGLPAEPRGARVGRGVGRRAVEHVCQRPSVRLDFVARRAPGDVDRSGAGRAQPARAGVQQPPAQRALVRRYDGVGAGRRATPRSRA